MLTSYNLILIFGNEEMFNNLAFLTDLGVERRRFFFTVFG